MNGRRQIAICFSRKELRCVWLLSAMAVLRADRAGSGNTTAFAPAI
jgi:hypothetical protein